MTPTNPLHFYVRFKLQLHNCIWVVVSCSVCKAKETTVVRKCVFISGIWYVFLWGYEVATRCFFRDFFIQVLGAFTVS